MSDNESVKVGVNLIRYLMMREVEAGRGRDDAKKAIAEIVGKSWHTIHQVSCNRIGIRLTDAARMGLRSRYPALGDGNAEPVKRSETGDAGADLLHALEIGRAQPDGWTAHVVVAKGTVCRVCHVHVPRSEGSLGKRGVCMDCREVETGEVLSQARSPNSKPEPVLPMFAKERACLHCETRFHSEWAGNRICNDCKMTWGRVRPRTGPEGSSWELA